MAKLINKTSRDIQLFTRHVVPRNSFLNGISNETIRCPDNWPSINGACLAGQMEIEFDPEPSPEDETKMSAEASPKPEAPAAPAPDTKPVKIQLAKPTDQAKT